MAKYKAGDIVKLTNFCNAYGEIISQEGMNGLCVPMYKFEGTEELQTEDELLPSTLTKERVEELDSFINGFYERFNHKWDEIDYIYKQLAELKHRGDF